MALPTTWPCASRVKKLSTWRLRNMRAPCFPSTAFLVFALCLYEKFCLGVNLGSRLSLRGGKASPMAGYWKSDSSDIDIFEYNAIGMDPIQDSVRAFKSGKGQVKATGENGATTENPAIQKIIDNTNYAQRFFTGRKVADDCPTFPFATIYLPQGRCCCHQPPLKTPIAEFYTLGKTKMGILLRSLAPKKMLSSTC